MIAVDTNILVFAHRRDSPWHGKAYSLVAKRAEERLPWAIPWPCVHEFLAIVTHPRIYKPPTPLGLALDQVDAWMESPSLVLLGEDEGYWEELKRVVVGGRTVGPVIHDARVATLCRLHAVGELWTADRDFGRFSGLKVVNPLIG